MNLYSKCRNQQRGFLVREENNIYSIFEIILQSILKILFTFMIMLRPSTVAVVVKWLNGEQVCFIALQDYLPDLHNIYFFDFMEGSCFFLPSWTYIASWDEVNSTFDSFHGWFSQFKRISIFLMARDKWYRVTNHSFRQKDVYHSNCDRWHTPSGQLNQRYSF